MVFSGDSAAFATKGGAGVILLVSHEIWRTEMIMFLSVCLSRPSAFRYQLT